MPSPQPGITPPPDTPTLSQVSQQFPQFAIWCEAALDRPRFVAKARELGTSPHTLVTADLEELRDALTPSPTCQQAAAGHLTAVQSGRCP